MTTFLPGQGCEASWGILRVGDLFQEKQSILLQPGSLLVMAGEAKLDRVETDSVGKSKISKKTKTKQKLISGYELGQSQGSDRNGQHEEEC